MSVDPSATLRSRLRQLRGASTNSVDHYAHIGVDCGPVNERRSRDRGRRRWNFVYASADFTTSPRVESAAISLAFRRLLHARSCVPERSPRVPGANTAA